MPVLQAGKFVKERVNKNKSIKGSEKYEKKE